MIRIVLALSVLALSAIACGQYVPTVTPTAEAVSLSPSPLPASTPTVAPTASPTPSEAEGQTATVRAASVNVRSEPNGEVVRQIYAGQDVTVIVCNNDHWCEIEPDGWVWQGCLSINDGLGCEAK